MPIFDRYRVPQAYIPTVRARTLPADTTVADIFSGLARVSAGVAGAVSEYAERKRKLDDATLMAEREMRAALDIDAVLDGIRSVRDAHGQAPEVFQTEVTKIAESWTQGMRPEQAAAFRRSITPRLIDGLKVARELKNKYDIDNAQATLDVTGRALVDRATRLDRPDAAAFDDFAKYQQYLDSLVSAGLITADKAVERLDKVQSEAAYARLQRMTVSDNPQRAIDVLDEEEAKPGSTFARHIPPKERNTLRADAAGKLHSLRIQQRQDDEYVRQAREREIKELSEATELMFEQKLDAGQLRVDDLNLAAELRLLSSEKYRYFSTAIERRHEEGKSNPETLRQITSKAYDIRQNPARVQEEVESAYARGLLSRQHAKELLSHLQTWRQHLADQARSDDKELIKARHGQVEQIMRVALPTSGSGSAILEQIGQQTLATALEDLGRVSIAMRPGGQDPMAWWEANKNRYLSVVTTNAASRVNTERAMLPAPLRGIQHIDELKGEPTFMSLPRAAQQDIYERVKSLLDLERAMKSLSSPGGGATAPQNTKGVPQGDKKSSYIPPVGKKQ